MKTRGRPKTFEVEFVLDKIVHLFWQHGYDHVSTEDICQLTGLSKPSLYLEFGNKEELFISCVKYYNENYASKIVMLMDDYLDPVEGVEKMLYKAKNQFTDPDFPSGCLALTGLAEIAGKSQKIDSLIRQVQSSFIKVIQDYFDRTLKRSTKNHRTAAEYVVGQLYALALFSKTNSDFFDLDKFVKIASFTTGQILGKKIKS